MQLYEVNVSEIVSIYDKNEIWQLNIVTRYCDCFANGLNCQNCACLNCHNDTRHEDERAKAIAATLERNPNAFKSKMYKFG